MKIDRRRMLGAMALSPAAVSLPASAAVESVDNRKILRYAFESAETGFDPVQISDLYSRHVARMIFDAVTFFPYLGKPGIEAPNTLSEMPTISSDSRTFTYRVKPGIHFADDPAFKGQKRELVAADYVYSIKRFADPRWNATFWTSFESFKITGLNEANKAAIKSGKFDYDAEISGLRVIDRYTFQVRTDRANPRFSLGDSSVCGAVAREVVEMYGDDIMSHPVGTGPFKLAEWRRSSFIALERNPNFREVIFDGEADPEDADAVRIAAELKGKRLPLLDRIEIAIIPEQQPLWLSFLGGEQDLIDEMPRALAPIAVPNGKPSKALAKLQIKVERVQSLDTVFQVFNMDDPVLGGYTPERVALRRALALAMDTASIIRQVYKGQAQIAQTPMTPMTYGYDPTAVTEMGQTDPARANAMLDIYGYQARDEDGFRVQPNGQRLELTYASQPEQIYRVTEEVVKRSFNSIGIRVRFSTAQWAEQLRTARSGQFQIWALGASAAGPDGASIFSYGYGPEIGGQNLSRFSNKLFDELWDKQDAMPDSPERLAIIKEMNDILMAYMPMNFLANRFTIGMTYPWVKYYRRWPFVDTDFLRYVDIDVDMKRKAGH